MAPANPRSAGCLLVAFVVVVASGLGLFFWLRGQGLADPVPGQQRCVATAGDESVTLNPDQAHFTSIIVGLSVRRGLAPRAASIAIATVYQETGIRNLDYGDRDSVGLFQQRPSQGWGTVKQIMDPYYSTGKFYDAMVKVKNWETDDINDVAQKVQRSGYPEAYRDHEADAQVLASALTGRSPAGFSCLDRSNTAGKTTTMVKDLERTFGNLELDSSGAVTTITAESRTLAWTYAHFAVANAKYYGVTTVTVGNRQWRTQTLNLPPWDTAPEKVPSDVVEITVR